MDPVSITRKDSDKDAASAEQAKVTIRVCDEKLSCDTVTIPRSSLEAALKGVPLPKTDALTLTISPDVVGSLDMKDSDFVTEYPVNNGAIPENATKDARHQLESKRDELWKQVDSASATDTLPSEVYSRIDDGKVVVAQLAEIDTLRSLLGVDPNINRAELIPDLEQGYATRIQDPMWDKIRERNSTCKGESELEIADCPEKILVDIRALEAEIAYVTRAIAPYLAKE